MGAAIPRSLGRAALLAGGFAVALGVAEVAARRWSGVEGAWFLVNGPNWYDTRIFQPDAELGQALKPGSEGHMRTPEFDTVVRVNSLGTRGPELGPRAEGELRVLAVGDSFTLAVQVDEDATFCAGLSRRLAEGTGRRVTVVNAGVDGAGTYTAARQATRLAPKVGADLVLFTLYLGNDLEDDRNFRPDGYPTSGPLLPSLASPLDRAFAWSALYFHANALARAYGAASDPGRAGRFRAEAEPFVKGADLGRLVEPTRRALQELHARARALGVPVVVALAPPAFVVTPERARATFDLFGVEGDPDLGAAADAVRSVVPDGMPVVDLAPGLRDAAAGGRVYFVFDGHWTPRGHDAVAEALGPVVRDALER